MDSVTLVKTIDIKYTYLYSIFIFNILFLKLHKCVVEIRRQGTTVGVTSASMSLLYLECWQRVVVEKRFAIIPILGSTKQKRINVL